MSAPTTDDWLAFEDGWLAPYAMPSRATPRPPPPRARHPFRSLYQRDRERIVHCSAFRRMTGKTQVLVASVNDHHRTRLTHTLEVTQVARTVARRLRLNEDLTEAIALAHDIGHPPFGHAGEAALDECLKPFGGFDHNLYGLRRVDELEERYPQFPGLNLSFEVREAFVQHSGRLDAPECAEFRDAGRRCSKRRSSDVVDSIAYDTHDIDDALGLGLHHARRPERRGVLAAGAGPRPRATRRACPAAPFRTAVVRELLAWQVTDLLDETARRLAAANVRSVADVRAAAEPLVGFGPEVRRLKAGAGAVPPRAGVPAPPRAADDGERQAHPAGAVRGVRRSRRNCCRRSTCGGGPGPTAVVGPPPPGWLTAGRTRSDCWSGWWATTSPA